MSLKNSLFLVFLFTSSAVYAGPRPDRMKQGKPLVCPATKEYNVGDRGPANGWIIYKKPAASGQSEDTCWQYIEAAPYDQEKMVAWSNITNKAVGGTSAGVGTGKENTQKIIAQTGHTNSAAKYCVDYAPKGYPETKGQWFLPSRDELDLMYQLLAKGDNKGGFVIKNDKAKNMHPWYWSSSDNYQNAAWYQNFIIGHQDHYLKYDTNNVRCARAF
jgi:hypothetical protein